MMKIPDKVKIAGQEYQVIWDNKYLSNEGIEGLINYRNPTIMLCNNYRGQSLSKSYIEGVFWHEILHAIDTNYNNHSLGEKVISRLGVGLNQILKDNFKLSVKKGNN